MKRGIWRAMIGIMTGCLFGLMLFGCTNQPDGNMTLHVKSYDWSGWSAHYEPEEHESVYSPKTGDMIFSGWDYLIRVKNVSADSVTLSCGYEYDGEIFEGGWCIVGENGGLSLMPEDGIKEYTMNRGEKMKFATQTMDAGWFVEVECK